ncbi:MAG: site-2 protease family protein [Candidatus Saccharibacteria bacterium]|nr:site-2 protease family protein [Candidatus Saccharibacteria bacterium]
MNSDPLRIVIVLIIAVFSVILHELAHGVAAYWLGDRTAKDAGRLTLNPLKHIDPFMSILVPVILYIMKAPVFGGAKPVPVNYRNLKGREWGMALVAIAGPLTNFLIALIAFLIGYFSGALRHDPTGVSYFIFAELVYLNLGFMLFNLIPIPPLDGSRVLYAIAPDSVREIMNKMEVYGFIIVYALILIFGNVFSSLMLNGMEGIINFFYLLVGQQ